MRATPPLTASQLGPLATATLDNSVGLIGDAQGLAAFNRVPVAYSIAILAAEEFGKHLMCFGAAGADEADADYWTEFWRRFRDHRPKYENAFSLALRIMPPDEQQAAEVAINEQMAADQRARLAGFYVDFIDGRVVHPDQAVSEEQAARVTGVFADLILTWARYWDGVDFGVMFDELKSGAQRVQKMVANRDDEGLRAEFRRLRGASESPTPG